MSWEFENLFNAERMGDGSFLEEPSFLRVGEMGYRRSTTVSGPRLDAEVYPAYGRDIRGTLRRAKHNLTREAQQRANDRRSSLRLIQQVEANFTDKDITIGLDYDNDKVPADPMQVKRDVHNYLNRVRTRRRQKGLPDLKYIVAIGGDEMPGAGYTGKRPHAHVIMSGGLDRDELEELWGKGHANTHRLQPRDEGLGGIAVYFTRQKQDRPKKKGEKSWWGSRNLIKPIPKKRDANMPNSRVKRIAYDFKNDAKAIMEKLYPGYQFQDCKVYYSDVVDGVYIRCVMRKTKKGGDRVGKFEQNADAHQV